MPVTIHREPDPTILDRLLGKATSTAFFKINLPPTSPPDTPASSSNEPIQEAPAAVTSPLETKT